MPSSTTPDMANRFAVRHDNTPTSAAVTAFKPTAFVHQQRMMNCRLDDILTFISVVEAGSLTSAATRLNVSKSVVSKLLKRRCGSSCFSDPPAG
jgi:Bacterial regulatory helix-turn-helix protein, lysR family